MKPSDSHDLPSPPNCKICGYDDDEIGGEKSENEIVPINSQSRAKVGLGLGPSGSALVEDGSKGPGPSEDDFLIRPDISPSPGEIQPALVGSVGAFLS